MPYVCVCVCVCVCVHSSYMYIVDRGLLYIHHGVIFTALASLASPQSVQGVLHVASTLARGPHSTAATTSNHTACILHVLAGLLVCLLACLLACLFACLLVCLLACLLAEFHTLNVTSRAVGV